MNTKQYTLESIQAQTEQLKVEARKSGKQLKKHFHEVFAPPATTSDMERWVNHAESAYALYDGLATGYKLLKNLFGGRRRRSRSRAD